MRWFKKMACTVNGLLWINGCVNFNRDFTIQNPIASRFHCKTMVLKKNLIKSYTTLKVARVYCTPCIREGRRYLHEEDIFIIVIEREITENRY